MTDCPLAASPNGELDELAVRVFLARDMDRPGRHAEADATMAYADAAAFLRTRERLRAEAAAGEPK